MMPAQRTTSGPKPAEFRAIPESQASFRSFAGAAAALILLTVAACDRMAAPKAVAVASDSATVPLELAGPGNAAVVVPVLRQFNVELDFSQNVMRFRKAG